ncbi:MAG: energy transducer TonB [Janthinobacterium lividum]
MNYPDWLLWLGGTLLPLGLLWLLWRLALQRERCYGYNRALLLLAPLVAAALPLLPHPALPAWLAVGTTQAAPVVAVMLPTLPTGATAPLAAAVVAGWPWLLALYAVGVALGLTRLAGQVQRLRQLAQQLPQLDYAGYTLVRTGGQLPTSSFGRVVFWDETVVLAPAEATAVLAHELAHVRQCHTFDVLWLQVWRAVLWPNPFAHLLLPALRFTHELLADQAATATSAAAPAAAQPYATLLARLATRQPAGPAYSLLQPFAFSATLTRIAMLKTQIPVRRWKQWLVLPALGGLFIMGCQSAPAPALVPPPPPPVPTPAQLQALEAAAGPKIYTYVEQMPQLPSGGGQRAIVERIQANLVYPAGVQLNGRVFASFMVGADGRVGEPVIVKGLSTACDQAVLAAIKQLPQFTPGKQSGKAVAVSFTVPVQFEAEP